MMLYYYPLRPSQNSWIGFFIHIQELNLFFLFGAFHTICINIDEIKFYI
jgi:hypothetical protein